jgi:hypothetical protein
MPVLSASLVRGKRMLDSAAELKDLLAGVAAYAANGREGLERLAQERPAARLLLTQIK